MFLNRADVINLRICVIDGTLQHRGAFLPTAKDPAMKLQSLQAQGVEKG